jgi:hypothetical protein
MATPYLTSAALMGVLLLAVAVWALSARDWYHYRPTVVGGAGGGDAFAATARFIGSPVTWTVSFLVFVFALLLAALAFVGSETVPLGDVATVGPVMGAVAAVLFAIYLFAGTYYMVKSRGLGNAAATASGSIVVAITIMLVVFVRLFFGV